MARKITKLCGIRTDSGDTLLNAIPSLDASMTGGPTSVSRIPAIRDSRPFESFNEKSILRLPTPGLNSFVACAPAANSFVIRPSMVPLAVRW
jgi:hypothetical protein